MTDEDKQSAMRKIGRAEREPGPVGPRSGWARETQGEGGEAGGDDGRTLDALVGHLGKITRKL